MTKLKALNDLDPATAFHRQLQGTDLPGCERQWAICVRPLAWS